MIRPANFGFNPQTAVNNTFQNEVEILDSSTLAQQEFDGAVATLRQAGVEVVVIDDTPAPIKPDAVFPNNWVSFHPGPQAIVYPMFSPNRQDEVRIDIPQELGYEIALDLRESATGAAMEGTGSLVFDHENKIAYACLSPRTDRELAKKAAEFLGYRLVTFLAESDGVAIYHTNVVMAVGEKLIVICKEVCRDTHELDEALAESGKEILDISAEQLRAFAGNMLQLRSSSGNLLWALSQTAWDALNPEQQARLAASGEPVPLKIPTIETLGGGSVRCMLAELF